MRGIALPKFHTKAGQIKEITILTATALTSTIHIILIAFVDFIAILLLLLYIIMPTAQKIKSRESSRNWLWGLLVLALLVILIFLTFENLKVSQKREKLQGELKVLEKKVTELNGEREALQSRIFQGDDTDYLERVAREELNLKKEGESVVAFPVLEEEAQAQPKDLEQQTLWQKIMEKIR